MLRIPLALAAIAAGTLPALAGGYGCTGNCYRQEYVPPSYRTVAERVMVRAPRTYAYVTPAQYGYVNETVQVSPASRYWTVKHDHHGRKIGCWVEAPARYASVSRKVMLRGPEVVPQYVPAQYAVRHHTVQDSPGYKTWVPLGGRGHGGGYGYGSTGGGGYGYGYASYGADEGYSGGYGGGYGRSYGGGGLIGAGLGVAGAGLGLAGGAVGGFRGGYDY